MSELCTDNSFELIEKYKQKLIDGTNIEMAPDEMAVIDDILFRFWQMDWLDKLDADAVPVVHGKWEWNTNNGFYYCSNCKTVSPREDQDGEYCDCPNYCPNCGARMDGGKDDE